MRYRPAQFAKALHGALKGKSESERKEIVRRFASLLARHRMSGKLSEIFLAYERIVLRERSMRKVRIESPDPLSGKVKSEVEKSLAAKVYFEESVRPELIAGMRLLVDNELLIDASAKGRLERMLRA